VILLSLKGNNLQSTIEQIQEYLKTAREILKFKNVINFVSAILFGLVELTGQKEREDIVRLVGVDREDFIEQLDHYVMTIPYIYLQRAMVATLLEQQSDVAKYCQEAEKNIAMTKGSSMELELCFYKGLWLTNKYPQQPPEEQAESLVQITEYLHTLQELSSVATHYRHKYLLLKAKFMLITGDYLQACMLFDQAIEKAEKQHCLYVVALSLEYMLCFLDEHKKSLMMRGYLIKASEIYQIWGSYSKLIDLEKWHPESQWKEGKYLAYRQLLNVSQNNPMYLDFESLLKTNQMISKQYKIEDLLYHLLSIIFKSIGAAKGILFSLCDNEYVVEAHIAIPDPLGQPNDPKKAYLVDYPESIINYVKLNKRRIIIPNTSKHYQFQHDPYLSQLPHSSIICSPIIKNNTLMAILYLENNQLPDTFTEKNCHILEMISGQLAISIENARYCMSLEQKVKEQTDEWKNKQANFIYSGKLANLVDIVFGATNEFNNSAHYTKMAAANIQDKAIEFQQFLYSVIEEKEVAFREIIQRYLKHIIDNTTYILGGVDKTINIIKYLSDFIARDKTEYMSYDIVDGFNKTAELFLIRYQSDVNLIIDLPESLEIKCYPQEINQVFMIILTNAGQAIIDKQKQTNSSQKGDIKVTFIRQDEYYFRIEISDNGCGMDKITSSRLFDSFFTTRGPEHFGLGLHIAQNMIEKCHGSISAKSNSGEGTTFRIHLPFHP
jgi:signal transduction histidine kinase